MATITWSQAKESPPEKDGRKYVTYEFRSSEGDTVFIGPVLEPSDVNLPARRAKLKSAALVQLGDKEHHTNREDIKTGKKTASAVVYKYNPKANKMSELYLDDLIIEKQILQDQIDEIQPAIDDLKTYLGV